MLLPTERLHAGTENLFAPLIAAALDSESIKRTVRGDGLSELWIPNPLTHTSDDKTEIFALLGEIKNENGSPAPAVVLLHGGGGTAFPQWVKIWNSKGFTAIAVALEGQTDEKNLKPDNPQKWIIHSKAGPSRKGIYEDSAEPLTSQWMYHAVSAAILARKTLLSLTNTPEEAIGLVGISWGGIVTSTTVGFDKDFAFAIPIYGSGYLNRINNQYRRALSDNQTYLEFWEPGLRIADFEAPLLFVNGISDSHFSLLSNTYSGESQGRRSAYSFIPELLHSHAAAWSRPEPYAFARMVLNGQDASYPAFNSTNYIGDDCNSIVRFEFDSSFLRLDQVELITTDDPGLDFERNWERMVIPTVQLSPEELTVTISRLDIAASVNWFVNVTSIQNDGLELISSSPVKSSSQHCSISRQTQ